MVQGKVVRAPKKAGGLLHTWVSYRFDASGVELWEDLGEPALWRIRRRQEEDVKLPPVSDRAFAVKRVAPPAYVIAAAKGKRREPAESSQQRVEEEKQWCAEAEKKGTVAPGSLGVRLHKDPAGVAEKMGGGMELSGKMEGGENAERVGAGSGGRRRKTTLRRRMEMRGVGSLMG